MSVFETMYDPIMIPADVLGFRRWRTWATSAGGGRILELGVGSGLNLLCYRKSAEVCAIDPSEALLSRAVRRAERKAEARTHFCRAQAEDLPFRDRTFDAAVGTLVFCTIADPVKALLELRRVLKPGARLRLIEHVRVRNRAISWIQDALAPGWKKVAGGCVLNRETAGIVICGGFEILSVKERLGGLFVLIEAVSTANDGDAGSGPGPHPAACGTKSG